MDDQLFETFYEQTSRPLWAYVARIAGNASAADDILQEAYLKFLLATSKPSDPDEAKRYLYKIATNLVYERFRTLGRRREAEIDEASFPIKGDIAAEHEMARAFAKLRMQERMLLWLAYVEGYDHEQIAKVANVNKLSVKVLLFRARRKLAALLK